MVKNNTEIIEQDNNKIIQFPGITLDLWNQSQLNQFKETYTKGSTPQEFGMFVQIIRTTWLNPFKKELWFVKYWNSPAQIFIWRDWYRKVAKQHSKYAWHRVDVVCEKDIFKVKNGQLEEHSYSLKDRWKILGAYCIIKVKLQDEPMMHYVDFNEYSTWMSNWKTKPKTMIKKVAEAQALRMAFVDLLEWTYDESEQWNYNKQLLEANKPTEEELKEKLNILPNNKENENK